MATVKTWYMNFNTVNNSVSADTARRYWFWYITRVLLGDTTALTFNDASANTITPTTGRWTVAYSCSSLAAGTGYTQATGKITISGGSSLVGAVIGGTTVTVTWATSDNNTASLLSTAINNDPVVSQICTASVSTNVVTCTARSDISTYLGTGGNSITLVASGTGVTVSGATFGVGTGTTGVNADGTDRLGSTWDATKNVYGTSGSAHSWMVLKSPQTYGPTNRQIFITFVLDGSAATTPLNAYMSAAPPVGGTTTASPTQVAAGSAGGAVQIVTNGQISENTSALRKSHGCLATDGSYFLFGSRDTSGFVDTALILAFPTDYQSNDKFPYVSLFNFSNSSPGALASGRANGASAWAARSTTDAANVSPNGMSFATSGGSGINVSVGVGGDAVNGIQRGFPIVVGNLATAGIGYKGVIPDLQDFSQGLTGANQVPASGTPEGVVVGINLVPGYVAMSL